MISINSMVAPSFRCFEPVCSMWVDQRNLLTPSWALQGEMPLSCWEHTSQMEEQKKQECDIEPLHDQAKKGGP